MNYQEIRAALNARYAPPGWALLPEVTNATGAGARGQCDFVAVGLWPSRGLEVIGIEVKCSRGDWLRELKRPAKAERFFDKCNRWYLAVADRAIVKDGELPTGWGLLVPRGASLVAAVDVPARETMPDRRFWVALIRRASEWSPGERMIAEARKAGAAEGEANVQQRIEWAVRGLRSEQANLIEAVKRFEEASGVSIGTKWTAGDTGKAVRLVRETGIPGIVERARATAEACHAAAARIDAAVNGAGAGE